MRQIKLLISIIAIFLLWTNSLYNDLLFQKVYTFRFEVHVLSRCYIGSTSTKIKFITHTHEYFCVVLSRLMSSNSAQQLWGCTFEWVGITTTLCVQFIYVYISFQDRIKASTVHTFIVFWSTLNWSRALWISHDDRRGSSEQISDTTNLKMEYIIIKENVKVQLLETRAHKAHNLFL
jgi:hypothetical protein